MPISIKILANFVLLLFAGHVPIAWQAGVFFGSNASGGAAASYLFYGNGCTGTSSNSCTVGGTSQGTLSTFIIGFPVTMGSHSGGYTPVACGVDYGAVDGTSKNTQCAIYSGTGGSTTKLCSTSSATAVTGWQEVSVTGLGCGTLSASSTYTIAWQVQGDGTTFLHNAVTTASFVSNNTFGTWDASLAWQNGSDYSIYVKVTAN